MIMFFVVCLIFFSLLFFQGHLPSKAGKEPGELGEKRAILIQFLQSSKHYIPERLLTRFPLDGEFLVNVIIT